VSTNQYVKTAQFSHRWNPSI